jgi:hypothetical protein
MFPKPPNGYSLLPQSTFVPSITPHIPLYLTFPEVGVREWNMPVNWAAVEETAVKENSKRESGNVQVWRSQDSLAVSVNPTPWAKHFSGDLIQHLFGSVPAAADTGHDVATLLNTDIIHH